MKAPLVDPFCEVSGGPCRLNGPDMRKAHSGVHITRGDFNALVELLCSSSDAGPGIAFPSPNRPLARLARMHREIVNAH